MRVALSHPGGHHRPGTVDLIGRSGGDRMAEDAEELQRLLKQVRATIKERTDLEQRFANPQALRSATEHFSNLDLQACSCEYQPDSSNVRAVSFWRSGSQQSR